jgi:uncharacterized Zn finger protein (UPF0148 family)
MSSPEDNLSKIKAAASLLVRGGTLTSEACDKCSGVQVRFADNITCVNCGNVVSTERAHLNTETNKIAGELERSTQLSSSHLDSAARLIEEKIGLLASEIRLENDMSTQRQKAELLETYLRILEKTKDLMA